MADISIPVAGRITPLGKPKKPVERPEVYSGKSPDEPADRCDRCASVLVGVLHEVVGPMSIDLCNDLRIAEPKRSNGPLATFILWRWLFATPNPVPDNEWYRIMTRATCPSCRKRRCEKDYRRGFSRFRLGVIWLQAKCGMIERREVFYRQK
jgi:hypothetical protein